MPAHLRGRIGSEGEGLPRMEVEITARGEALTLSDLALTDLGPTKRARVGRIEPASMLKRLFFRLVRALAGDRGRAAAWTRTWRGPWRARILASGESHEAPSRAECERWERQHVRL